ncbi:MAG: NAD(P)H-hydrate dehydratase [Proteobacteria bacterium]|nr:NAD(P)H-hydrate dehydratase [Pseudomonadota bacterium]
MADFDSAVLTVGEMYRADEAATAGGIPGGRLMEAAGKAIADAIAVRWTPRPVSILCGPGNNGGDGFVVARILEEWSWPVRVGLLGDRDGLKGDARLNADRWAGPVEPLSPELLAGAELVVDALFGAGLARELSGMVAETAQAINDSGIDCVAVDMPSGVHGDSGAVLGAAAQAQLTVTFFRHKPGHLLYPGRGLCGEVMVADIGIPEQVLDGIAPAQFLNGPGLWRDMFPWPTPEKHKYSRGHALIVGGAQMTGAARMAAQAARRAGAGVVTVLAPPAATLIYRMTLVGSLFGVLDDPEELSARILEQRVHAALLGPGNGVTDRTKNNVIAALGAKKPVVLDADALMVFGDNPAALFAAIDGPCLLTPHEGEFVRLFGDIGGAGKMGRVRAAAERSGAVVLLKGPDTVIAAPDGRAAICCNAPPELATAGAGDVLAGFAVALMAQGMPAFEAACCAAWLHGEAASAFGPGLIAEDIAESLPEILRHMREAGGG